MDSTEPRKLADVIRQLRQAEEKLLFVRETALLLQEPVLAYLSELHECMMDAYSDHINAIMLFTEDAIEQQEEEDDKFEELFREVKVVMAKKVTAARRSSVPQFNAADQLAAEAWLKQQFATWESLKVDVSDQHDGIEEAMPLNRASEVVVTETLSEFGTDFFTTHGLNQQNSEDSPPCEISDSTDEANREPQQGSAESYSTADLVDHPASTGSRKAVTISAMRDQLLPATNQSFDNTEGDSKTEPEPDSAHTPATYGQPHPGRVHPDSGLTAKAIEVHNPLLPSMGKAPDKRGHLRCCRFHLDYGARPTVLSGQPGHSQQSRDHRSKGWRPTVPPDKPLNRRSMRISFRTSRRI